jgi:lipoprotein-anchoring transpeptidase ErfK/SrfK
VALHAAPKPSRERRPIRWVALGVAGLLAVLGAAALFLPGPAPAPGTPAGPSVPVADLSALPVADTTGVVPAAPADDDPTSPAGGIVVHPLRDAAVYAAPGGAAIARLPRTQFGDTWLPVVAERDGWVRVLLPSKPNGSTGWLAATDVRRARNPYVIKVHLASFRMVLLRDGAVDGSWTVGTGKAAAPTPAGRTFVLGAFADPKQRYSPVILPLGAHSPTHDTFGGGPGTVALHTWPSAAVFGTASSDGCIRVPRAALDRLTEVPLGTLVLIDEG